LTLTQERYLPSESSSANTTAASLAYNLAPPARHSTNTNFAITIPDYLARPSSVDDGYSPLSLPTPPPLPSQHQGLPRSSAGGQFVRRKNVDSQSSSSSSRVSTSGSRALTSSSRSRRSHAPLLPPPISDAVPSDIKDLKRELKKIATISVSSGGSGKAASKKFDSNDPSQMEMGAFKVAFLPVVRSLTLSVFIPVDLTFNLTSPAEYRTFEPNLVRSARCRKKRLGSSASASGRRQSRQQEGHLTLRHRGPLRCCHSFGFTSCSRKFCSRRCSSLKSLATDQVSLYVSRKLPWYPDYRSRNFCRTISFELSGTLDRLEKGASCSTTFASRTLSVRRWSRKSSRFLIFSSVSTCQYNVGFQSHLFNSNTDFLFRSLTSSAVQPQYHSLIPPSAHDIFGSMLNWSNHTRETRIRRRNGEIESELDDSASSSDEAPPPKRVRTDRHRQAGQHAMVSDVCLFFFISCLANFHR